MSIRKDSANILIFALIGFVGIDGIHRFVLGQAGVGILYLLADVLCHIETIVDFNNYKKIALGSNIKTAQQVSMLKKQYS